jgi:hypothetical protein
MSQSKFKTKKNAKTFKLSIDPNPHGFKSHNQNSQHRNYIQNSFSP